jgi:hypothetical protein
MDFAGIKCEVTDMTQRDHIGVEWLVMKYGENGSNDKEIIKRKRLQEQEAKKVKERKER